jgi:high-affinity nickel-transport protein
MSAARGWLQSLTSFERLQLRAYGAVIVGLHIVGWGLVYLAAADYPFVVGLAGLAYTFGLRHAFDADHIAAIDNTTRKLMQERSRPLGVGFFFALGHSTVVLVMTLAVAVAAHALTGALPSMRSVGSLIGTTISGVFLYIIGILNLLVMLDIWRVFRAMRRGTPANAQALEARLQSGGLMARWFGRVFTLVSRPRHLYWVGLLFGLGFDTATEVALLTTAGVAASQALPLWAVLSLPIVFAAGMSLLDTADGVLMCCAYGWALKNPLRKVFYNLSITGLSVVVALFVGTIELAAIVSDRFFGVHHGIWGAIQDVDFQTMGYAIVALFVLSWMVSAAVWKFRFADAARS